eukprot:CAMPEP_0206582964 /NCGR_PEP_ID=MMETSP0325_2-20121206/34811_1 /ASSEMBLY_ACC=CAM_ASM_000347 /TAXON_ID=2866 /ORGANISM="Crypthecodinium cohnii, Strain Seligo" /LENGTH=137 /DNA_ID=CAMNT_0054089773 /DNA_START=17 /DNA_END=431 /DNA_ORIENTATION=+
MASAALGAHPIHPPETHSRRWCRLYLGLLLCDDFSIVVAAPGDGPSEPPPCLAGCFLQSSARVASAVCIRWTPSSSSSENEAGQASDVAASDDSIIKSPWANDAPSSGDVSSTARQLSEAIFPLTSGVALLRLLLRS